MNAAPYDQTLGSLRLPLGRRDGAGPSLGRTAAAVLLMAGALVVAVWRGEEALRAVVALGLVAAAAAVFHGAAAVRNGSHGLAAWLVVDSEGIARRQGDSTARLALWGAPFGLTVFSSTDGTTLLLAFTRPDSTRFVVARRGLDDLPFGTSALARAVTLTDSDLPAGQEQALSVENVDILLAAIAARAPGALDRVYLSDAGGDALTLDRSELRIGATNIDLEAPLEWRAFLFQERGAYAASVCQATWVRQADVEVVLVAPMPGDSGWLGSARAAYYAADSHLPSEARITLARDVRLMQASAGDPPPRETRHAIDRLFMLPLRRALDTAPRASRTRPSLSDARAR
ncbi:MAG: hypothetical protein ACRENE_27445 [Polyangiaceae bacterium]